MATLQEMLLAPDVEPHVYTDVLALVDSELKSKSGMSGTAVKVAFKAITSFAPGYYQETVQSMIPGMTYELEPYWADFQASGSADFGDYLAKRGDEVAEALLSVSDARAKMSERPVIIKAYGTVRGGAARHITAALPAVGVLVEKYAG